MNQLEQNPRQSTGKMRLGVELGTKQVLSTNITVFANP